MQSQADLAKAHGIQAFCFWHYWFNGKLLLERPLLNLLSSDKPDFQYCLAWANENWTRRWDGQDQEILQKQDYGGDNDDLAHFKWLLPFLKDERAFRIANKPIFLVYRPGDLPDPGRTLAVWRKAAMAAGLQGIFAIAIKTSFANQQKDWTLSGFDGELIFQPNFTTVYNFANAQNGNSNKHTGANDATIVDYHDIWQLLAKDSVETENRGNVFTSVVPGWDNTARRSNGPLVLRDSNPEDYAAWLTLELKRVSDRQPDRQIVFINAWNEWAEGNHLEPDLKFGRAFLEATKKAVQDASVINMDTDAITSERKRYEELYQKAQESIEAGDRDKAVDILNAILDGEPNNVSAMNDLAVLYTMDNKMGQAMELLNRLVDIEPGNIVARGNLGKLYLHDGKIELS